MGETIDLSSLIGHRIAVDGGQTLGEIYQIFSTHGFDFIAVLENRRVLGLCCRRDVGMLLGGQYGFSLYSQKPIREHLHPKPVSVRVTSPLEQIFNQVFSRTEDSFYDDVLLLDDQGCFLGCIFIQTLIKLQNRLHVENICVLEQQRREIKQKNESIEADLHMARELQQAFLPVTYPCFPSHASVESSAFRLTHCYLPHDQVGGDFFFVKQVSDFTAGILIADVMGHGVRSALVTAILKTLLDGMTAEFDDPDCLLDKLNRGLSNILARTNNGVIYVTALYLLLDAESQTIRYSTAGHPHPLLLSPNGAGARFLLHPEPGLVLGVFENARYPIVEHGYSLGDRLLLFTDGILEIADSQGNIFGQEGMVAAVTPVMNGTGGEIINSLLAGASTLDRPFSDDVCLVAVELRDPRLDSRSNPAM